jgi:hypothetical protein
MDELERRLRSALTEMAEEVPPSHHAWAEHERRLALKSRRARVRPVLMAAAAVVALIAIPVVVLGMRTNQVDHAAIPTSDSSSPTAEPSSEARMSQFPTTRNPYQPVAGEKLLTDPVWVAGSAKGSFNVLVYAVYRDGLGGPALCYVVLPNDVVINGPSQSVYGAPVCTPVKPPAKKLLWSMSMIPNTSPPGTVLYVMGPQVDTMLVRRGEDDAYRLAYTVGKTADFAVLAVSMGSPLPPKAYTARDKASQSLENG